MNSLTACSTSLLRALLIAAMATWLAYPIRALLARTVSRAGRRLAWAILLAPFLTPSLIVGYAYNSFAFSMVHHPAVNQLLYALLVTMKLTPVAVLLVLFAPAPPLSAEAVHAHRLLNAGGTRGEGDWRRRWSALAIYSRGPARTAATAFALTFLLAFQEFEIASLMAVRTWSVWLFDAQAGGLALRFSLLYGLPPFICEVVVLLPVAALLLRGRRLAAGLDAVRGRSSPWRRAAVWAYLATAVVIVTVAPASILLISAMTGFRGLFENFPLAGQLGASLLFASGAALGAYLGARWLTHAGVPRRAIHSNQPPTAPLAAWACPARMSGNSGIHDQAVNASSLVAPESPRVRGVRAGQAHAANGSGVRFGPRLFLLAIFTSPGLFGPLLVGLTLLYLFQLPVLNRAYDTPVPLLTAMFLLLLAPAALLMVLFHSLRSAEAAHAARLLLPSPAQHRAGRRLLWDLQIQPQLWVFFLLFCLGFFDLTSASLLAPSSLTPATIFLFNLMHYGRNAALSAMVCMTVAIPVMLLAVIATGRWWGSWIG